MNSKDFRQNLVDSFIEVLEKQNIAWKKGWMFDLPFNDNSKLNYKGINLLQLYITGMKNGYIDPRWLTFKQIEKYNKENPSQNPVKIKKGEKATPIEYYTGYDTVNKKTFDFSQKSQYLESHPDLKEKDLKIIAKTYYVFNCSQLSNYPAYDLNKEKTEILDTQLIEDLAKAMNVKIYHDNTKAFYELNSDTIHLPPKEHFKSQHEYDFTLLHEVGHATGHETRLNRHLEETVNIEAHAYEELVAEMSACFFGENLIKEFPLEHLENHQAYVQSWIQALKNDSNILFKAIKEAQQVADYMNHQVNLSLNKNHQVEEKIELKENTKDKKQPKESLDKKIERIQKKMKEKTLSSKKELSKQKEKVI